MKILIVFGLIFVFVFDSFGSLPTFNAAKFIQIANGGIAGTVTDKNNKFIASLKVKIVNVSTKKRYKTKTDKAGYFKVRELPLGTYTIKFEGKKGFAPKTIENVEVGLNGGVVYNTTLEAK